MSTILRSSESVAGDGDQGDDDDRDGSMGGAFGMDGGRGGKVCGVNAGLFIVQLEDFWVAAAWT